MEGNKDFVAAPCEKFLDHYSKDQRFEIAEEHELDVSSLSDKQRQEDVKAMVRLQLFEKRVLISKEEGSGQHSHYFQIQIFTLGQGTVSIIFKVFIIL